jgi:hypothetical protein
LVAELRSARLASVETEPRLDTSRPTLLRAGGFLLCVIGALSLGVGAIVPWVTVGIPNESAHSSFRGTDLPDGRVVLFCAFVVLVAIMGSRLVRSTGLRLATIALTLGAGLLSALVAAAFIGDGRDRGVVLDAIGVPRDLWAQFGVFRDLGAGAYLALAGGVLCIAGAIMSLRWARRLGRSGPSAGEVSDTEASG